jgi:multidrug resistance efflux pump
MNTATISADGQQKDIDFVELGKSYTPPPQLDTSAEVADVIERMPWWAARGLLYIIISFIVVALVWAAVSIVDVVAESRGTRVLEGYAKPVQVAGAGVVQNVFVKEGETVKRGQALVQLDATEMRTRLAKLREELRTNESQLRQSMVGRPVHETQEQQNRISRLESDVTAAELELQHSTITAPVDGLMTTFDVRGVGVNCVRQKLKCAGCRSRNSSSRHW